MCEKHASARNKFLVTALRSVDELSYDYRNTHCNLNKMLSYRRETALTVFTQRNFVADFLQAKSDFLRKFAVLRFSDTFWGT